MSAIIGASIIGAAHGERAANWAQLNDEYKRAAFVLHRMALLEEAEDHNHLGPIYVRQALNMQRHGIKLGE